MTDPLRRSRLTVILGFVPCWIWYRFKSKDEQAALIRAAKGLKRWTRREPYR